MDQKKEKQTNVFGDVVYVGDEGADAPGKPKTQCVYFDTHTQLCTKIGSDGYLLHCRGTECCGEYKES